jgi:hypothetical protein
MSPEDKLPSIAELPPDTIAQEEKRQKVNVICELT